MADSNAHSNPQQVAGGPNGNNPSTADQLQQLARRRQQQQQVVQAAAARQEDLLPCQWTGCTEACPTAELLYDHVCERHVGRKSTNNLNLICGWGTCRTATVKRDHITSHIRVHVPLKPHRCHFCGKCFKRPQDLKKHIKTHADNADDMSQPEPSHAPRSDRDAVYRVENGKVITDLQALAATATGYYDTSGQHQGGMPHQGFGGQASNGNPGYYGGQQPPYGGVYYSMNSAGGGGAAAGNRGGQATYDSRRRGYEALNDFFGDAKRHQIDPTSSRDVGQRLLALQGLQLPESSSMADYQVGQGMADNQAGGGSGPLVQHQYSLPPMHHLRTKTDLHDMDRFLEQMQSTVYESSNQAAAAGVAQPGAVFVNTSLPANRSPPHAAQFASSHQMDTQYTTATLTAPTMATASSHGTPALTPPSSALSHTSGHSPTSNNANGPSMSPLPMTSAVNNYPSLPAVSSSHDMLDEYSTAVSAAPAATLGGVFDNRQPRRYSGGMLQQAATHADSDGDARSSKGSSRDGSKSPEKKAVDSTEISSALIDPALSGLSSPSADDETMSDRIQEAWVENIRVVEALRKFVAERLERHEYDDGSDDGLKDDDDMAHDHDGVKAMDVDRKEEQSEAEKDTESLYPVLRALESAS